MVKDLHFLEDRKGHMIPDNTIAAKAPNRPRELSQTMQMPLLGLNDFITAPNTPSIATNSILFSFLPDTPEILRRNSVSTTKE
jgi:hypothetical protein